MVAGHAHHQCRQTETDAWGGPAGEQPGKRKRQDSERTAGHHGVLPAPGRLPVIVNQLE